MGCSDMRLPAVEVEAEEEAKVSNACRCSWWLHALVHITVKWYILIARGGRTLAPYIRDQILELVNKSLLVAVL